MPCRSAYSGNRHAEGPGWTRAAGWFSVCLIAIMANLMLLTMPAVPPMATGLPAGGKSLNIKDFGAKGDGIADDYDAMKAAAAALCSTPGATLTYPPGAYRIARYRITGGPHANAVTDITYDHCRDAKVVGDHARIVVTGLFHRASDYVRGRYNYSYTAGVIPFDFVNSSRFALRGFDISGDVQHTTRDPDVAEYAIGAGIRTGNSSDYTFADIRVHDFATDGLYLGAAARLPGAVKHADRNATLSNVTADHNARNGLSLIEVRGVTIIDSTFTNNGRTEGSYGGHAPRSGLDIEPVLAPPDVDVETGDIRVLNSRFEENVGIQLVSGAPQRVESIDVAHCYVRAEHPDDFSIAFAVFPRVGTVKGCRFEVSGQSAASRGPRAVFLHDTNQSRLRYLKQMTYQGNTFDIDTSAGVVSDPPGGASLNITFNDNTINIRAAAPDHATLRLRGLALVSGNRFSIDAAGYAGGTRQIIIRYDQTKVIRDNTYTTNLTDPRKRFIIIYPKDAMVANETYAGNISP